MSNDKPEWLEHLSVLRVQPGDTLVVRASGRLSMEAHRNIKETIELHFPNARCLVIEEGMDLGVVRGA